MWRWLLPCVYFWRLYFLEFLAQIPFLGPIIGGVGDYFSGKETNEANAEQAALNRQFQERMSSTSYQRATADMSAAGLNPMLAYQQGGASSPGGSTATMQNPMSSAIHSAATIAQTKAQTENIKADTANKVAEHPGKVAISGRLSKELLELVPEQIRTAQMERELKEAENYFAQFEKNTAMSSRETSQAVFDYFMAKFKMLPVSVRQKMAETTLTKLEGEYYLPKVAAGAAANLLSGAGSVSRFFGGRGKIVGRALGKRMEPTLRGGGYGKSFRGRAGRPISDVDYEKELRK